MIGMIVWSRFDGLFVCHDRTIEIVHRSRPLESALQCVPQIVKPRCTIGMIDWDRFDGLLGCHDRTIEVVHRSGPLESTLEGVPQIVEACRTIGMIDWGRFDGLLVCRDRTDRGHPSIPFARIGSTERSPNSSDTWRGWDDRRGSI